MPHRASFTRIVAIIAFVSLTACAAGSPSTPPPTDRPATSPVPTASPEFPTPTPTFPPTAPPHTPLSDADRLLWPDDLVYLGAFRLPDDAPPEIGWAWSGEALTYYPDGDPGGPDDGTPGSLFGTGHDWNQYVSEISIPVPVISPTKSLDDLNTATTLQPFQDIRGGLFDWASFEIPRAALEYLPAQDGQSGGKLYFCWGQHFQEDMMPSHGWVELDLSNPQTAGPWYVGDNSGYTSYATNDYMFAIPQEWADMYVSGMALATGRFRDGGWSGMGPSLFAIAPWQEGNPPSPGTHLLAVPLLLYASTLDNPDGPTVDNYRNADEWTGGAWLTAGERSAVIFVGTKGTGGDWYGFANGVVWPEEGPFPEIPEPPNDDRGWWSNGFVGQIIFYDPAELAAVTSGEMQPYEPQPYAVMNVDDVLFHITSAQQKHHLGAAAYDRERGLLYVMELFGDGEKPLVHVWRVGG